jgi:hypothetical protein
MKMNDVCDTWRSPWAALQKTLAKGPAALTYTMPGGVPDAVPGAVPGGDTWLGRARHPAGNRCIPAAAPAL